MIYLAEMLRDCSKSRAASFTQLSFPIIQEIQSKIKGKNFNLRKKMKQRLADRQKLLKNQQKKQEAKIDVKKESSNLQRAQKQAINYIQAYEDIKNYQPNKFFNIQLEDLRLDEKDNQICFQKKPIYKAEEIKRKLKSKEHPKRISFKQCDCCQKVGKHKCQHKFCEGKCQKIRKAERIQQQVIATQDRAEDFGALDIAQDIIDQQAKQENIQLPFIRITKKEEEPLILPKIDMTDKQEIMKEQMDGEIVNQRERISQNESKSSISQSISKKQIERNQKKSPEPIFASIPLKQQEPINQQQKQQQIQIQNKGKQQQIFKIQQKLIIDKENKEQMIAQQNEIQAQFNDPNEQMHEQWSEQDDLEEFQEVIPEQQIKTSKNQIKILDNSGKTSPSPIQATKSLIQIVPEKQIQVTAPIISTIVRQQTKQPVIQEAALQISQNNAQFNEQSDNFIDHLLQELEEPIPMDENQFLME